MPTTILAPAYNEEDVIARFVEQVVPTLAAGDELLVVDDGSNDATADILRRLLAEHPRLRVVTHVRNQGLGAALVTGFAAASGDVVVTLDADLSHPLELVPVLVEACGSFDAAYASRFVPGGGMEGVPGLRAFISRVGNAVIRRLLRIPVRDTTTGFRAYRRDTIEGLTLRGTRFEVQLEITARLVHHKARIVEIPMMLTTRAAGESKMRYLALLPAYGRMFLRMVMLRWFGIDQGARPGSPARP